LKRLQIQIQNQRWPQAKTRGVASVTVDVENVVLPGILSRYSSLAARWTDTPPYTDKP
jgi:hypothetical protein